MRYTSLIPNALVAAVSMTTLGCSLVLPLGPEYTFGNADAATHDGAVADSGVDASSAAPHLVFVVEPTDIVAGEVVSPAVQVEARDAGGNPVPMPVAITVTLMSTSGSPTLNGTDTLDTSDGAATFDDLSINLAGSSYSLSATADGFESAVSAAFDVSAGAPVRLAFRSEPTAVEGQVPFDPVDVAIEDALGNLVASAGSEVTLVLSTSPTGEALSGTTSVAAVDGLAQFTDLTLARPSAGFVLEASSPGLEPAMSGEFSVGLTFATISAGAAYTCATTVADFAYCWGSNRSGRLGDGTEVQRETPTPVAGGLRFSVIRAGTGTDAHTCGLTTTGAAHCWGSNRLGKLGDGTADDQTVPTPVAGGLTFADISVGQWHTCGVTRDDVAYCWGDNEVGAVGDGTSTTRQTPTVVDSAAAFSSVSAGPHHSCGLSTLGTALCWGSDGFGQIGNGSSASTPRLRPTQIVGHTFTTITTGGRINDETPADSFGQSCGVTPGGAAYCWGLNDYGRLGDGTTTARDRPELVIGGLHFEAVETGFEHTCGVTDTQEAYCWGANYSGQLGDETTTQRHEPVLVSGEILFQSLSAGSGHTCGLTPEGLGRCWGSNGSGELGDGSLSSRPAPQPVMQ